MFWPLLGRPPVHQAPQGLLCHQTQIKSDERKKQDRREEMGKRTEKQQKNPTQRTKKEVDKMESPHYCVSQSMFHLLA